MRWEGVQNCMISSLVCRALASGVSASASGLEGRLRRPRARGQTPTTAVRLSHPPAAPPAMPALPAPRSPACVVRRTRCGAAGRGMRVQAGRRRHVAAWRGRGRAPPAPPAAVVGALCDAAASRGVDASSRACTSRLVRPPARPSPSPAPALRPFAALASPARVPRTTRRRRLLPASPPSPTPSARRKNSAWRPASGASGAPMATARPRPSRPRACSKRTGRPIC